MKTSEFIQLAKQGAAPRMDQLEDQSLTLFIMTRPVSSEEFSKEQLQEFEFHESSTPDPNVLAKWIVNAKLNSVDRGSLYTAIPKMGMKNYTCDIEGDIARGVFHYEIPKYCRGQIQFTAIKEGGDWQISEFAMPAIAIKLAMKNKKWKLVD